MTEEEKEIMGVVRRGEMPTLIEQREIVVEHLDSSESDSEELEPLDIEQRDENEQL